MRPHKNLEVSKLAMDLVRQIYLDTEQFPPSELYGLTNQLRRAAVSIPSNLAEGAARKGTKEFRQFLNVAQGSISELDTQIELAFMLGYIRQERYADLIATADRISRMMYGLAKRVNK